MLRRPSWGLVLAFALVFAAVICAALLAGCGNMNEPQAREAMRRCMDAGGVPDRRSGVNGEWLVICQLEPAQ